MKFLKKINKGLALTVILVIGVIIYLIIHSASDEKRTNSPSGLPNTYYNIAVQADIPENFKL